MSIDNGREDLSTRHRALAVLIGAYSDGELDDATWGEVGAHLLECSTCRQDVGIQGAIRDRMSAESAGAGAAPIAAAGDLWDRVLTALPPRPLASRSGASVRVAAQPGATARTAARSTPRWAGATWLGWGIAAGIATMWAITAVRGRPASGMSMSMGTGIVVVDSTPESLASAAIDDFRRVNAAELPALPNLRALEARVPFSVPALRSAHMRLIGTWVTRLHGQPVAVLAYRCHDRLVVQYVVPEPLFFLPPRVRQAIATNGLYATGVGGVHTVGWPGTDNGSLLVGEFSAAELAAMRL
jgi:anti-sigma factor RsiW